MREKDAAVEREKTSATERQRDREARAEEERARGRVVGDAGGAAEFSLL